MNDVVRQDVEQIVGNDLPWTDLDGRTVLVTGATGMVGQYLVRALLGARDVHDVDVRVLALVRSAEKARRVFGAADLKGLSFLVQDVSRPIELDGTLDVIIHAASPAQPTAFRDDPVGVITANILGSYNTLELAKEHSAKFCFISTMEVYGQIEGEEDVVVAEDGRGDFDWFQHRSAYPESKRSAETLALAYGAQHDVDYTIARMTHTYGPGMGLDDPRVQAQFLKFAMEGEDIVLKSDGSLRRTYTYIADAVTGVFHVLLQDDGQRVYNIANEDAKVSIRELAETVLDVSGGAGELVFDIDEDAAKFWSKTRNTYADSARLCALGWRPTTTLRDGMARTVAHHRAG